MPVGVSEIALVCGSGIVEVSTMGLHVLLLGESCGAEGDDSMIIEALVALMAAIGSTVVLFVQVIVFAAGTLVGLDLEQVSVRAVDGWLLPLIYLVPYWIGVQGAVAAGLLLIALGILGTIKVVMPVMRLIGSWIETFGG